MTRLPPCLIAQIPVNCFAQALFKRPAGLPAEFIHDAACVDGVAPVVAGAVGDKGDEFAAGAAVAQRSAAVELVADGIYDIQIGALRIAAHIIAAANLPTHQNGRKGLRMVFNMEPVAHIVAFAIDRQGLALKAIQDHQRNEFFRKLAGAVIVAAVRRDNRQPVGVMPGAHQVIGGSLA